MNYRPSFLGLDLGEKTLGIAFSETGILAVNLKTLIFPNNQYHFLLKPLKLLVIQQNIKTIVLGYPKHMNNDLGIKATISVNFKSCLEKYLTHVFVVLWDERLSTKQALQYLCYNKSRIKKLKDEVAAMLILQNFLDYCHNFKKIIK